MGLGSGFSIYFFQEGAFHPWQYQRYLHVLPKHDCSTAKEIELCIVDEDGKKFSNQSIGRHSNTCQLSVLLGMEHKVRFHCCECEPISVTMVRARIWPASPQYPRLAFTFELMDLLEALLLECHVAVKDFCGALFFKCPFLIEKVRLHMNFVCFLRVFFT